MPIPLPSDYDATRTSLHRVAVHVLARRRAAVTGRFGLRVTPGGIGTPAFGDPDHEEVLRISGGVLVREQREPDGMHTTVHPIAGATLADLARFVGVELAAGFSVGRDTPELGAVEAPLEVSGGAAAAFAEWMALGALAVDNVIAALGPGATPSVAQVWPEHFDLGCDVDAGSTRANLGFSAGDGFHTTPYAYVGPWSAERPGDPEYWNASFGALVGAESLAAADDPVAAATGFLLHGVKLLAR